MEGRESQVRYRQQSYKWQKYDDLGLPSSINSEDESLLLDERFDRSKNENFLGNLFKGLFFGGESEVLRVGKELLSKLFGDKVENMNKIDNVHAFYDVVKLLEKNHKKTVGPGNYDEFGGPIVLYELARWTSDVEFGRQVLNGVNCVMIKRCVELPSNFPVTQGMVKCSLVRSGDLIEEMKVNYMN